MRFGKKRAAPPSFPPETYEPVLRRSICTGERTACMRHRETGKIYEIMLIRNDRDLAAFAEEYGLGPGEIRTIY